MKKFFVTILVIMVLFNTSTLAEGWMYASGDAYVRVAPSINSDTLGVLYQGEEIWVENEIYTKDGRTWCQVDWHDQDGYISKKNLVEYKPYEEDEGDYMYEEYVEFSVIRQCTVYDTVDGGNKITTVEKGVHAYGSYIAIDDFGQAWLEIYMEDDNYGFISLKNLKPISGSLPPISKYLVVTTDSINVRDAIGMESSIAMNLHKGDHVQPDYYLHTNDGRYWAFVEYKGEPVGYVSCRYLAPMDSGD